MENRNVHAYAVVRLKFLKIASESDEDAINKVIDDPEAVVNFHSLFDNVNFSHGEGSPDEIEYAEEFVYFLVDREGDTEYEKSVWYGPDGKTLLKKMSTPFLSAKDVDALEKYLQWHQEHEGFTDEEFAEVRGRLDRVVSRYRGDE